MLWPTTAHRCVRENQRPQLKCAAAQFREHTNDRRVHVWFKAKPRWWLSAASANGVKFGLTSALVHRLNLPSICKCLLFGIFAWTKHWWLQRRFLGKCITQKHGFTLKIPFYDFSISCKTVHVVLFTCHSTVLRIYDCTHLKKYIDLQQAVYTERATHNAQHVFHVISFLYRALQHYPSLQEWVNGFIICTLHDSRILEYSLFNTRMTDVNRLFENRIEALFAYGCHIHRDHFWCEVARLLVQ